MKGLADLPPSICNWLDSWDLSIRLLFEESLNSQEAMWEFPHWLLAMMGNDPSECERSTKNASRDWLQWGCQSYPRTPGLANLTSSFVQLWESKGARAPHWFEFSSWTRMLYKCHWQLQGSIVDLYIAGLSCKPFSRLHNKTKLLEEKEAQIFFVVLRRL